MISTVFAHLSLFDPYFEKHAAVYLILSQTLNQNMLTFAQNEREAKDTRHKHTMAEKEKGLFQKDAVTLWRAVWDNHDYVALQFEFVSRLNQPGFRAVFQEKVNHIAVGSDERVVIERPKIKLLQELMRVLEPLKHLMWHYTGRTAQSHVNKNRHKIVDQATLEQENMVPFLDQAITHVTRLGKTFKRYLKDPHKLSDDEWMCLYRAGYHFWTVIVSKARQILPGGKSLPQYAEFINCVAEVLAVLWVLEPQAKRLASLKVERSVDGQYLYPAQAMLHFIRFLKSPGKGLRQVLLTPFERSTS